MSFLQWIRSRFRLSTEQATGAASVPDAQSIKQRGWLQWSCVASNDIPQFLQNSCARLPGQVSGNARLLIVTQSCDLVHGSYENEPAVEAYLCEPLSLDAKADGNLTAGKNPRSLQVQLRVNNNECWFQLRSSGHILTPRHYLASIDPDPSVVVTDTAIDILQRWIINRLVRTAFPDAFNDRTRKARGILQKQLKKGGADLLGLYINLTPWDELAEHQRYVVDLVGLVEVDLDIDRRAAVDKILGQIAAAYDKTDCIESCDYQVLDADEARLSLLQTHRLFPLDFLSLGDKPSGDLPPLDW